jgi:hypothetical protein
MMKYSLLALTLGLVVSTVASADPWDKKPKKNHDPDTPSAPEVDPGMAMSGLALLAGALTVVRARRK